MIHVENQNEQYALQMFLLDVLNLSGSEGKDSTTKKQKEEVFRQASTYLRGILMQQFDQEGKPIH